MAEELEKKEERKAEPNDEKKEGSSSLKTLLEKSDVLLMLYPKDEEGYFSASISAKDEITIYNLLRNRKETKDSLVILLDTSGGNVYSAVK